MTGRRPAKTDISLHRILEVSYSQDRLVCTCGVVMRAQHGMDWRAHRLAVGETVKTLGYGGVLKASA